MFTYGALKGRNLLNLQLHPPSKLGFCSLSYKQNQNQKPGNWCLYAYHHMQGFSWYIIQYHKHEPTCSRVQEGWEAVTS